MSLPVTLYSAAQVRELDRIAIEDFAIDGYSLMDRAGSACFAKIRENYPETQSICVVCGSGNNGGDGYIIARLAVEAGISVNVIQLGNVDNFSADATLARNNYLKTHNNVSDFTGQLPEVDVIVDAIFGTGLTRDVSGNWADVIKAINACNSKVLAVDIPSGLCADTGSVLGIAVEADITVTFIGLKAGLFTGKARDHTGKIIFNDLDVQDAVYAKLSPQANKQRITSSIIKQNLPARRRSSHKGDYGHILLVGGNAGMSGAIRLASEAALRSGAGLVSVATHPDHAHILNTTCPEIMVHAIADGEALTPLLQKVTVVGIGPGLGQSEWSQLIFDNVIQTSKPMVIDADALNLLAKSATHKLDENCVLTPHPGEAARLLQTDTKSIEKDRYSACHKIARKVGGCVVLKGAGTIVVPAIKQGVTHTENALYSVCTAGNPGMASGGMGDVLTGILTAMLGQGLKPYEAAQTAVQMHTEAADLAAIDGERGMLASDLFPHIRSIVNNLKPSDKPAV